MSVVQYIREALRKLGSDIISKLTLTGQTITIRIEFIRYRRCEMGDKSPKNKEKKKKKQVDKQDKKKKAPPVSSL
jgi:hypothetical protein